MLDKQVVLPTVVRCLPDGNISGCLPQAQAGPSHGKDDSLRPLLAIFTLRRLDCNLLCDFDPASPASGLDRVLHHIGWRRCSSYGFVSFWTGAQYQPFTFSRDLI